MAFMVCPCLLTGRSGLRSSGIRRCRGRPHGPPRGLYDGTLQDENDRFQNLSPMQLAKGGLMRGEPLDAETIVSAAEEVLRRHGPEKATVLDVARVLGVSHGSVYRHFPSKMALREAEIRRWLDRVREDLAAAQEIELAPPDRLRGLLTTMFAAKWTKAREDPELFATFRVLAAGRGAGAAARGAGRRARSRAGGAGGSAS